MICHTTNTRLWAEENFKNVALFNKKKFTELELKVLRTYLNRDIKTVRCMALAIGRLGGHQNRKSDGMPGLLG